MEEDIPEEVITSPAQNLEVESSKQYKKHPKTYDDLNITPANNSSFTPKYASTPTKPKHDTTFPENMLTKNYLPKIPNCPQMYQPMAYTFRVPAYNWHNISMGKAQSPPFNLQLDNALAVIWCLFSKNTVPKPLGIAQLQWALSFLRTIVNRRGEHPKDVDLCIQAIMDQLIDLYGDMADEIPTINKVQVDKDRKQKSKKRVKHEVSNVEEELQTSRGADKPSISSIDLLLKTLPFSVNYVDMINTSHGYISTEVDGSRSGKSINTPSRDELVGFLHNWKQEQIDKIQAELQRLRSIENFIGSCEKNNLFPNIGDKDLHVLLAEKNKRTNT